MTKRRFRVLTMIREGVRHMGYSPSYAGIGDRLGISSVTVWEHIQALVAEGHLVRTASKHRNLRLPNTPVAKLAALVLASSHATEEMRRFAHVVLEGAPVEESPYRPAEGLLEILATGNQDFQEELAAVFCVTVLGLPALPPPSARPAFDLSVLLDRQFTFPTEPEDKIEAVYLKELNFQLPGHTKPRLDLRARTNSRSPHIVHNTIDRYLQDHCLTRPQVLLTGTRLQILFRQHEGQRAKSLSFRLSLPNICTLKDDAYDQIAKRCLVRWGLARDGAFPLSAGGNGAATAGGLRAG